MIMKKIILLSVVSFAAIIARAQSFHYYPLKRALKKSPFFMTKTEHALRFVTSLSANRLNKAKIDR